jgi:uncharacterized protein (TIGR02300 family)
VGELGTKYKCFKCETKFYDLGRPLPICPICGEDQNNREPRQVLKRRRKRSSLKMEPDIPILPEEHDPLIEHEEHEGHEAEDHEAMTGMDEEPAVEHEAEEDQDRPEKEHDDDADEFGQE